MIKSGQLSKTSQGRAFQAEVTTGAKALRQNRWIDWIPVWLKQSEPGREQRRRKQRGSAPGRSCSGQGLVEIQLVSIIIIKQRRKRKVGEFEGILYNITSGTWIWLTGPRGVTVRFECCAESGAWRKQFWRQSARWAFSSIITLLAVEFLSSSLLQPLLSQWVQGYMSSGTQGMSRVYFQPHIEKCCCILWLECLPMSEYLSNSSPTSYQTGSLMRYVVVWLLSHVWLFATPWTIVHQAPPSMEFSRQEYRSGWVTISFSRGSSRPRNWTHISCIGRRILYHSAIWEALVRLRRDLKGCLLKMTFYFMWLMTPSSEMIKLLWFIWLVGVWPRIMLPGQRCFLLHVVH